jgi:DNA-binding MarR family transcriptional regulator
MSTVSRHFKLPRAKSGQDHEPPQAAIGRLLKNMQQSLRQAMEDSLRRERVDLSFAHFVTLYTLSSEPGVTGAELARRAFVTAQTMNTILRRLERDGAIERRPNPANQRADSWYVTKLGQSRLAKAQVVAEAVWSRMFESFNDREIAQLQRLLERCLQGLEVQLAELRSGKPGKSRTARERRPARMARRA